MLRQETTQHIKPVQQKKKPNKITQERKDQLLKLILQEGVKIKKASRQMKINYSSAKTILHLHRKAKLNELEQETTDTPCYYERWNGLELPNTFVVVSSLGYEKVNEIILDPSYPNQYTEKYKEYQAQVQNRFY